MKSPTEEESSEREAWISWDRKGGERREGFPVFHMFSMTHSSPYGNQNNDWHYLTALRLFVLFHILLGGWMLEERGWFALACAECLCSVPQWAAVSHFLLIVEILTQNCQSLWPLFFVVHGGLAVFFIVFAQLLYFLTPVALKLTQ